MAEEYVSRQYLLNEYDRQHQGPPGGARKIIAEAHAEDVVPVNREKVMSALRNYFSIGDSYTYELTRVKSAFSMGTMSLDDFKEWEEENISDLCDYIFQELRTESGMADEYIRKESVIDVARKYFDMIGLNPEILVDSFITMPPADVVPTEPQEIGYDQCANAMLKMWIDNVVTDGEYNRIMDRLNKHYDKRE